MVTALSEYLDSVRDNLRLDLVSEREVISELQTHIEDKFDEMREAGLSEDEAAKTCVKLLGSAKLVARQIAKEEAKAELPQTTIELLDSQTVAAAEGFITLAAARAAAEGKSLTEVVNTAEKMNHGLS